MFCIILNLFYNWTFLMMMMSTNSVFMLLMLILQGIFLSCKMSYQTNSWFILMIMLVYLGGVMVMFIYVNSILELKPMNMKNLLTLLMISTFSTSVYSFKIKFSMTNLNTNMENFKEIYGFFFMLVIGIFIFLVNKMLQNTKGTINNIL